MTFLYEYLMFLGQVVTLVIGFIVVASFLASLGNRAQSGRQGHLQVQKAQRADSRFALCNGKPADDIRSGQEIAQIGT